MKRIAFLTLFLAGIITSVLIGFLIRGARAGTVAIQERPRLRYASIVAAVGFGVLAFMRDR